MQKIAVVIPNWNGAADLPDCLDSLQPQTLLPHIIVVDNGSSDGSIELLENKYPQVEIIKLQKNHGFAGGVNQGIKKAMSDGFECVALLNNDAVADKHWLKHLARALEENPKLGIATSKILSRKNNLIDSTGDIYTIWGLPFPRGRGEHVSKKYDEDTVVFGASGGASLYRAEMFKEIGHFDEDFFAYYEDVDISFRAQLAGWKVAYVPEAIVYHQISATSSKIKGFATYHTLKNLPLLLWKNVPWTLMPRIWPRLVLAYLAIVGRTISRGQFGPLAKALVVGTILWPKKLLQRYKIQKNRKVTATYLNSIITHDLPPNAHNLRKLRAASWKLLGKKS